MNALASGVGVVAVEVALHRETVCAVTVRSSRPLGLSRLFVGRPAAEAPLLARQMFSLCGFAQMSAARLALASALGQEIDPVQRLSVTVGVLAEAAFETLRAMILGWPGLPPLLLAQAAPALRDANLAAQTLVAAAVKGLTLGDAEALRPAAQRLRSAAATLGAGADEPHGLFAQILRQCAGSLPAPLPDALWPALDETVRDAMRAGGERFCALPALPGLRLETGAYARHAADLPDGIGALEGRFRARLTALAQALDRLAAALAGEDSADDTLCHALPSGPDEGFAAVECARGRLYHRMHLDTTGRVADYGVLAPTEWNFHPSGPFVAALLGAPIGARDAVLGHVQRLAALFDPCVAFDVRLADTARKEAAHA